MASMTSFFGISLHPPRPLLPACSGWGAAVAAAALRFPSGSKPLGRIRLKREHRGGATRLVGSPPSRPLVVQCEASGGRITQQEFTEMAWQGIVSSPDIAKENKHQIVEAEHLMKALLDQNNGLARRIFSKAAVDNTRLLEATDKFIQRQPKKKVVIDPLTEDKTSKARARTIAVNEANGVAGERGNLLEVIAEGIDAVMVVDKIRNEAKLREAKLMSIEDQN